MATYTIPSKQNDVDKFKLYLNSIKNDLDPNKKNQLQDANTAKLAYNEWKDTWSFSKEYFKNNNTIQRKNNSEDIKLANDKLAADLKKKAEADRIKAEEDKNKADALSKAETITWNKWTQDIASWPWTTENTVAWTSSSIMDTNIKNVEDMWQKANEVKEANLKENAVEQKKIYDDIYNKAMWKYEWDMSEFLWVLDKVKEQNLVSIANQRKIADDMRESAWVASLIAWSKMWPWMSESQLQSLSKDISVWYQDAIAKAEWNYEIARINWWNTIKQLWVDAKTAKDILTQLWTTFWLAAAEPMLTALSTIVWSKNELIDKVNWMKTWTQTKLYEDAETKYIYDEAFKDRQNKWAKAKTPQDKMNIINQSIPKDEQWNPLFYFSQKEMDDLISSNKDWWSIFNSMWYQSKLKENQIMQIYKSLELWKIWLDEADKRLKAIWEAWVYNKAVNQKWENKTNIASTAEVTPDTMTEIWNQLQANNSVSTYNEQNKYTPINTKLQTDAVSANKNLDYATYISKLKPEQLVAMKKIAESKNRDEYIKELRSKWTPWTEFMIQYIEKNKPTQTATTSTANQLTNSWLKSTNDLYKLLQQRNYWNLKQTWNYITWTDENWVKAIWRLWSDWKAQKTLLK